MLYLNNYHIAKIGTHWDDLINVIESTLETVDKKDYCQPVKLYLRYRDLKNRIIAMPSFIGGAQPTAGIKWIASFPENIKKDMPRANSVTILNKYDTGVPESLINSNMISTIRTAAVTGLMIAATDRVRRKYNYQVGIMGFGPIGRMHLKMLEAVLGDKISKVLVFDQRIIDLDTIDSGIKQKISICKSWSECYVESDIFITCTVSDKPYVNLPPKKGSLQLNISLRDYMTDVKKYMDYIIVDDWNEVCRENTDIENMHKHTGLKQEDTLSLVEMICKDHFNTIDEHSVIMFNPMGMAVFDIAIGRYYYNKAKYMDIGINLPE